MPSSHWCVFIPGRAQIPCDPSLQRRCPSEGWEQVPCLCRLLSSPSVRLAHGMMSSCLQLMWAAGPSWLLVITVLEVISLIFTDSIPLPKTMPYAAVEQQAKPDIERGEPLLGKSQPAMSMCVME